MTMCARRPSDCGVTRRRGSCRLGHLQRPTVGASHRHRWTQWVCLTIQPGAAHESSSPNCGGVGSLPTCILAANPACGPATCGGHLLPHRQLPDTGRGSMRRASALWPRGCAQSGTDLRSGRQSLAGPIRQSEQGGARTQAVGPPSASMEEGIPHAEKDANRHEPRAVS